MQITNIRNEKETSLQIPETLKKVLEEYYEQLYD